MTVSIKGTKFYKGEDKPAQVVEPGDDMVITIRGKVPSGDGRPVFKVSVDDPNRRQPIGTSFPDITDPYSWTGFGSGPRAVSFDLALGAKVEVTYTSRFKEGVHIDLEDNTYWMRNPDGWHYMPIEVGGEVYTHPLKTAPKQPQLLTEDRLHVGDGYWPDDSDDLHTDEDQFNEWD